MANPMARSSNSRRMSVGSWLKALVAVAGTAAGVVFTMPGCSDHSAHCWGSNCGCWNNADCYQGCFASGCNLDCAQTAHSCDMACANFCTATCHDTNECTQTCDNNCSLDCHSTAACHASCGANCNYTCTDTTRCNVTAATGSVVTCDHVATCSIQCTGPCRVDYNSVDDCTVRCATGPVQTARGSGSILCN